MTAPRYRQIMSDLQTRIETRMAPGDRLPSESELVAEYGVNRLTVRAAIAELGRLQLVDTEHGKGSFVRQPPNRYVVAADREASLSRAMSEQGRSVSYRLLHSGYDAQPRRFARVTGDRPYRVDTMRYVDEAPWSLTSTWVHERFGDFGEHWLGTTSLYTVFEERYGISMVRRDRSFAAIPADLAVAEYLGIEPAQPVLRVRGVNVDAATSEVVAAVQHCFAGDKVEFATRFDR